MPTNPDEIAGTQTQTLPRLAAGRSAPAPRRPVRGRRRGRWAFLIGVFLVAVAISVWAGQPDTERYRRLANQHDDRAANCHRLEGLARAAGRDAEAEELARTARNHERFSRAYREQVRILKEWTRIM